LQQKEITMSTILTVPKLAMSMSEGTIAEWVVADGADVTEGQIIYLLESDKSTTEIEAPASGKLIHKAEAGSTLDCGTEIGEII
jgi:pyruvate/2-oxoglutarate dehydrogenase complex dihydrolipoamide acyltransferase (E2) component